MFRTRVAGGVSRKGQTRVHYRSNNGVLAWRSRRRSAHEEDRQGQIFEAAVSRKRAQGRLIDELLSLFGGKPVMAHMVKTGHLTLEDVREAEQELRKLAKKEKSK